ncbi:MAG: hypothetical protein ACK5JR_12270 [Tropicimonas sp.]
MQRCSRRMIPRLVAGHARSLSVIGTPDGRPRASNISGPSGQVMRNARSA